MINSKAYDYVNVLEKSANATWTRYNAIANNIANVDTPGYKTQYISFEEEFKNRLETAVKSKESSRIRDAIKNTNIKFHTTSTSDRLDGNNVDMDTENVELARTALQYQYSVETINNNISRYRTVIKG